MQYCISVSAAINMNKNCDICVSNDRVLYFLRKLQTKERTEHALQKLPTLQWEVRGEV